MWLCLHSVFSRVRGSVKKHCGGNNQQGCTPVTVGVCEKLARAMQPTDARARKGRRHVRAFLTFRPRRVPLPVWIPGKVQNDSATLRRVANANTRYVVRFHGETESVTDCRADKAGLLLRR